MISRAGHIALILPALRAPPDPQPTTIGIYRYLGGKRWHTVPPLHRRAFFTSDLRCAMTCFTPADKLHRLVKQALDSGAAASIAEAEALFAGYRLALRIDKAGARDRHHQAALLTAVALARRVFLGGVTVSGRPDVPLAVPLPFGRTLADAVARLEAAVGAPAAGMPVDRDRRRAMRTAAPFHVRAVFAGWRGGIVPGARRGGARAGAGHGAGADARGRAGGQRGISLHVSGACRLSPGGAPWVCRCGNLRPRCRLAWRDRRRAGALLSALAAVADRPRPSGPGLSLGARASALRPTARLDLILQDIDMITPSTESTSILRDATLINTRRRAPWPPGRSGGDLRPPS